MSFDVAKQNLEKKVFYYWVDEKKDEPRKDCNKCNRYDERSGTVHCDDYVAGWCKSRWTEGEGKPHDEKLITLSDVLAVLGDLQKTHILIEREWLNEQWRQEVANYPSGESKIARFIRKLEKAEKLLGAIKK